MLHKIRMIRGNVVIIYVQIFHFITNFNNGNGKTKEILQGNNKKNSKNVRTMILNKINKIAKITIKNPVNPENRSPARANSTKLIL